MIKEANNLLACGYPLGYEAVILVECGYALGYEGRDINEIFLITYQGKETHQKVTELCDPYSDAGNGRMQADALEDWFFNYHDQLWDKSNLLNSDNDTQHLFRLDRIRWCCNEYRILNS